MKKKIRAVCIMLVFACAVIGVYYRMNYSVSDEKEEAKIPKTTVEKLLAKDLDKEYPATVKTVIKLYSQYSKCFYEGEYTTEQLEGLVEQYRMLLDDELLANNPAEEQLKTLQSEINEYSEEKKVIMSYYWPKESAKKNDSKEKQSDEKDVKDAVTYYTKDGRKYASTVVVYSLKVDSSNVQESRQEFVLRQNAEGQWKILGWVLKNK